jgi:hypothetical protein
MAKQKPNYHIANGMVFMKHFYGREWRLEVVEVNGKLAFALEGKIFSSPTAAARHVYRDELVSISGPAFWNIQSK